ncbi:hypothetical protein BX265_3705 [Streptomyces sp. TLI_235]|nr:hypothetical protein [Streptomyces sp. TLI_235]PBC78914.1 hypothetical protein BX265_3705 [Streptomyces sp. TLI_235]
MSARRLIATAALLGAATLALTACDPNGSGADTVAPAASDPASASASPSSAASSSSSPSARPSGTAKASTRPSASHSGTAKPSGSGKPAVDCTAAAQRPGHKVVNVTAATAAKVTATQTRLVCGPDIDDDGYYEPTGAASAYTFAPGATAELFAMSSTMAPKAVSLAEFAAHAEDCAHDREVAAPYSCYGGAYDITVDSAGRITRISELFHP